MATVSKSAEDAQNARQWHVVDATDVPLGRLASEVATLIRGKGKVDFTPHVDCGDFVVVLNASKVRLTGAKAEKKIYYHHTQFMGGLKQISAGERRQSDPVGLINDAVRGMLPKNTLGHQMVNKLKVYAGAEHPHGAQRPQSYALRYSSGTQE